MSFLDKISSARKRARQTDDDLDEWERHHDDPRSSHGIDLLERARQNPVLTAEEVHALWIEANHLVGQRAPADYGEFLAYGYLEGRQDALLFQRESSLGRDAEGRLVLTLGPGAESPSRKEGWEKYDGMSPLEQREADGDR